MARTGDYKAAVRAAMQRTASTKQIIKSDSRLRSNRFVTKNLLCSTGHVVIFRFPFHSFSLLSVVRRSCRPWSTCQCCRLRLHRRRRRRQRRQRRRQRRRRVLRDTRPTRPRRATARVRARRSRRRRRAWRLMCRSASLLLSTSRNSERTTKTFIQSREMRVVFQNLLIALVLMASCTVILLHLTSNQSSAAGDNHYHVGNARNVDRHDDSNNNIIDKNNKNNNNGERQCSRS